MCRVQCKATYRTVLCVCCCVVLAKAGGRFIVAVSWPLRGLLHVSQWRELQSDFIGLPRVFSPDNTSLMGQAKGGSDPRSPFRGAG